MIFDNLKKAGTPADPNPRFTYHFVRGAYLQIDCDVMKEFAVTFRDQNSGEIIYEETIRSGMFIQLKPKYYIDYKIVVKDGTDVYTIDMDLKDKRVMIEFGSAALGDTLAWMPYVEQFRQWHECEVICMTFHNELLHYPDITLVEPGTALANIHAWYDIGWFYDGEQFDRFYHTCDPKASPLQSTAADILGLREPLLVLRPSLSIIEERPRPIAEKYICIAPHSTAQAKYWNHEGGWQEMITWLEKKGYVVVNISREGHEHMGNTILTTHVPEDYDMNTIRQYLQHCEFFVGIGSGLSWLAWAMNVKTVLISGFSEPWAEMPGVIRISSPAGVCTGCFNWVKMCNDGDWNWCPRFKDTDRQFECTKSIKPEVVMTALIKSCM